MKINADTKLAPILKHHPDALDAIVSIHPRFQKLRNPILRKLMAPRTSIRQAAKIANCTPDDFFDKLCLLGFEIDRTENQTQSEITEIPDFMKSIDSNKVISMDVRPILAAGSDPLSAILEKLKTIKDDEVLKVINSFEPIPLMNLLKKQGYESYSKEISSEIVETWFKQTGTKQNFSIPKISQLGTADWEQVLEKYKNKIREIDVRELEMPEPMMKILENLQDLPEDQALFVHHKRIPVYLLPELKDRRFDFRTNEISDGNVQLLIFKSANDQ
ncbi:hypothetical protein BH09BAC5_BH09BAC5_03000 [soil metagenome]